MIKYHEFATYQRVWQAINGNLQEFGKIFEFCYHLPGPFWSPGACVYFCRVDGTYQIFDQRGRYQGHIMPSCSLVCPIRVRSFM